MQAKSIGDVYEQALNGKADRYFQHLYHQIDFPKGNVLAYEAFRYAAHGYFAMKEAGKLGANALLTVCDFTLSANRKRMWVIDLTSKKVLFNTLVAHGMGSGEEFAQTFSNEENSHQSSLGFYVTGETYQGAHGLSLKLHGVDGLFNSKAYERGIVVHAADYVSDQFARMHKRLGRSHGCPALPADLAPRVIDAIRDGSCLFIYHTSANYLQSSAWLRKEVRQLPMEADRMDMLLQPGPSATARANGQEHRPETGIAANIGNEQPTQAATRPSARQVTAILVVHENERSGSSDTLRVR